MEEMVDGNMKIVSKEKSKVLAEQNNWTLARAEGFIDGERARRRHATPTKYVLIGIDDYCLGFRAGYFATARKSPDTRNAVG
jgi:hypothetical protein